MHLTHVLHPECAAYSAVLLILGNVWVVCVSRIAILVIR